MKKIMAMCALAAAITACGGAPMDNNGDTGNTDKPTVQLFTEFTYEGVADDIINAFKADRTSPYPLRIANYEFDLNGQVSKYIITNYRNNPANDASVIPAEGATVLEILYTFDPLKPTHLLSLEQTDWDFWWDGASGLLASERDSYFMLDENGVSEGSDVVTRSYVGGELDSEVRTISKYTNVNGRTEQIELYTNLELDVMDPVLGGVDFVEEYSYNDQGLLERRERTPSDVLEGYVHYDAYTYDALGALASQTRHITDDFFSRINTTFENIVLDDAEYGRVYVRIADAKLVDDMGVESDQEVKVYFYREAECSPEQDGATGRLSPQWYGCLYAPDWGE